MLSLGEIMKLDIEARLIGETLVINRSLDPLIGDYIELNDLNEPLELRINQVNDLMPTIEEGEVTNAPIDDIVESRNDKLDTRIDDYPSDYDYDKKIHIDCAYNLKFSCMIGFEFMYVNFFLILYVNLMSKKFYNSIIKDKLECKGNNIVGALMNVPIFVGTFYVIIDFAFLEDMDAYHDERMGDVIIGEPFLREVGIKARRFEGTITLYRGNKRVTYQMVRSHPRFKKHTNQQCNKIPPLLKASIENNLPNQTLPNPHIKDTSTSPLDVSHPLLSISPINPHETHTQFPPQSDNHTQHNQTQHTSSLSPSRESLVDDINKLQDLSNLLAMHFSQQQNNIPSSPYSPNIPHTLNIDQVETHSGYCLCCIYNQK
ncbi:hypothetical protein Tco_0845881 [Tanacetum coccineum]